MRRALWLIAVVALAHSALYILLQRADWESTTAWTDQAGYQRLGAGLATTGQFTRSADSSTYIPEVIRTPGYPALVALVYLAFGVGNHLAVAVTQAFIYAGICGRVFLLVRRAAGERAAIIGAAMTALYSPLAYFSGLIVTELWTAFMATAAMVICLRAARGGKFRDFAVAGALFSATTLVRPAFFLMPFFFVIAVPVLVRSQRTVAMLKGWALLGVVAALVMVPWFAYNYVNFGQLTLSPAGGVGRGLWEGSWQGRWTGRIQADLITLADTTPDREELTRLVQAKAAETRLPVEPMLQYVNEWRDIRAIWDTPTDPMARAAARVAADREYLAHALATIRQDPVGHLTRRLGRGAFVLWAAEIPIPYDRINDTPPAAIRAIWLAQVVLLLLAAWGSWSLVRQGHWLEAVMLSLPIIYVTGVHLPLLCEARQSLPVKPIVLALAAIGLSKRFTSPETAGS